MNPLNRRHVLAATLGAWLLPAAAKTEATPVEIWKSPDCGCCKDWVAHLELNGFTVRVFDTGNTDIRAQLGMPLKYGSCHTARVGGYAVEGHVPAREIRRLLKERPVAVGLAVPAMPVGSPGMDGHEYRGRRDPYEVLLVQKGGASTVFQTYR